MAPMIPRRALGAVILVWATVTWGGRIGLLTGPEAAEPAVWLRIVGSLATAGAAGIALLVRHRWMRPAAWAYAATAAVIWSSSLISVWADGSTSVAFRLVHTALAVVSLALAAAVVFAVHQPVETGDSADSTSDGTAVPS